MKDYLKDKKLNKIEKNKALKDGLLVGKQIDEFAKVGWQKMDKADLELRLKWYGLFWRPKSPGKFMLRLRIPNGILNSYQLKVIASIVARYGEDGSCDITTRQNLQLRGILINDLPEIIKRLKEANLESIQSGFDNPRNITGNPIAGIDPKEIVDTRPYTNALERYLTKSGEGNPEFSNLPRKWNTAVAGSYDNFLLHNDIIFHPVKRNNILGFSVWVGGILSSQLNEYAKPLNAWIPPNKICELTGAAISIWRNNGERYNRTRARFRFYLDEIGVDKFLDLLKKEIDGIEDDPGSKFSQKPRSFFGLNPQKQSGLYFAGLHVPVGRLNVDNIQDLSMISEKYGSGEIRLTEDQNIIVINIPEGNIAEFQSEPLINTFPLYPKPIAAGTVSCTGSTYCSFALTNTKDQATKISTALDSELQIPEEIKIHWTGCPNSCGQAYMGAIGLTGTKTKNNEGKMVEAYNITVGGEQGESPKLGTLKYKSIPANEVKDVLKEILITNYAAIDRVKRLNIANKQIKRFIKWLQIRKESSKSH